MAKTTIVITKKTGKVSMNTWNVDGTMANGPSTSIARNKLTAPVDEFEVLSCGAVLAPGRVWTAEIEGDHWLECLWESDGTFSWWLDGDLVAKEDSAVQTVRLPDLYFAKFVNVPGSAFDKANYLIEVIR